MTAAFRVLVTGSRTWGDIRTITAALDSLHAEHANLTVVHGACPSGADAIANQWARRRGVPVEPWPANWPGLGTRAGKARNQAMVDSRPGLCLAFIRRCSAGASHCAGRAEAAGIPTRRWTA